MQLTGLELRELPGRVRIQCEVESSAGREHLWYELENRHAAHLATDRYDGFLVGLLLKAMSLGEDVEIDGAVSERLLFNLTHYYTSIVKEQLPGLRPARIRAARELQREEAGDRRPAGVGTGFSAGIDSFALLRDHFVEEHRPGWRVTHLLFNNVGSHGDRDFDAARRLFGQRYEAIRGYPQEIGLDFIRVDSNLSDVLRMNFQKTHTPRNFSVVLLLQRLFGRYYYASTYRYRDCFVGEAYDMAFADPFAVHLLSTGTLDCISTGGQWSRVEKTARVAGVPGAARWLNVCTNVEAGGRNCSTCTKCCRTLLTLEMLGELEPFGGAFDLAAWKRVRNRFVSSQVLDARNDDAFARELREHARAAGWRFTPWQRAATALNLLPRPVTKLGRSIRRRWLGGA
jgi:hypothetical protein